MPSLIKSIVITCCVLLGLIALTTLDAVLLASKGGNQMTSTAFSLGLLQIGSILLFLLLSLTNGTFYAIYRLRHSTPLTRLISLPAVAFFICSVLAVASYVAFWYGIFP